MRLVLLLSALVMMTAGAHAMDCAKARTTMEKAICADPAAAASDEAMSVAFGNLKAGLSPEQSAILLAKQRQWLSARAYRCNDLKGAAIGVCLKKVTDAWAATLAGRPEAGNYDAAAFSAVVAGKRAKRNGDYDVTLILIKFRSPRTQAEHAFNAAVGALIKDAPMSGSEDTFTQRKLAYDVSMRVNFASPDLISATAEIYDDGGGAHPNSSTVHINIDGHTGKALTLDDVLAPDGRKAALKLCAVQIAAQRKEKGADEVGETVKGGSANASLADAFGESANWSFEQGRTEVSFDPYELGSYAEGPYSCSFDNTRLRALIRPGFPLPN